MPPATFKKQRSNFTPKVEWNPPPAPPSKISPATILQQLDRKIRELEKKREIDAGAKKNIKKKNKTSNAIKKTTSTAEASHFEKYPNSHPKGILRKPCSDYQYSPPGSFLDAYDSDASIMTKGPRKGFSLCEMDDSQRSQYCSPRRTQSSLERSPQKVRFQTGLKKKTRKTRKGKTVGKKTRICFSDKPSKAQIYEQRCMNHPGFNYSDNRPEFGLFDEQSRWADPSSKFETPYSRTPKLRTSNLKGKSSNFKPKYSSSESKFSNNFKTKSNFFKASGDFRGEFCTDDYKESPLNSCSSGFTSPKTKYSYPQPTYHNPNFDKIDMLINKPLANIDSLLGKYGTKFTYSSIYSSPYTDTYKPSTSNLSSMPMQEILNSNKPLFEKSYYLSGSFDQMGSKSKDTYDDNYSESHQRDYSENKTAEEASRAKSTIQQSLEKSPMKIKISDVNPFRATGDENKDVTDSSSDIIFNYGKSRSPPHLSGVEDLTEISQTFKSEPQFIDKSPQVKQPSKASSSRSGSCSPLVFESNTSQCDNYYEHLLEKYKPSKSSNCAGWTPQSKVLRDLFEDEYDGPWSRKKRTADTSCPREKYQDKSDISKGSVQSLINAVSVTLADAYCQESQLSEQDTEFEISNI